METHSVATVFKDRLIINFDAWSSLIKAYYKNCSMQTKQGIKKPFKILAILTSVVIWKGCEKIRCSIQKYVPGPLLWGKKYLNNDSYYLEPTIVSLSSEWQSVDLMPKRYVERRPDNYQD